MTATTASAIYQLQPELLQQIQTILDNRKALPAEQKTDYVEAYTAIFTAIKDDPAVDAGTKNWLSVAISVNSDNPQDLVFQYVRAETQIAVSAQRGTEVSFEEFHKVSNDLAVAVLSNIVTDGGILQAEDLVSSDVENVAQGFFASLG
jgi:hypothetical protein